MTDRTGIEIFQWEEVGYSPLVFFDGWQVALLNWEPPFDPKNLGEIERHNNTDEVFVLLKGKAILFSITAEGKIQVEEMIPHAVYNVTQATWHNLIASKDSSWIIVENRDTHLNDTEYRTLSNKEQKTIKKLLANRF